MDLHVIFYNFYEGHHIYHAYLNALYWANRNGGAIFTHQEYIDAKLHYEDAFFNVFEMEKISEEEKACIPQAGIPRSYFDSLSSRYGRTESVVRLFRERDEYIEDVFSKLIDSVGNVNRIYVFGEVYESIKFVARMRNIEIVTYEFSTVRTASDYSMNLMQVSREGNLYFSSELKGRYGQFKAQVPSEMLLSREQLISLFVPLRQLKYLQLIGVEPQYQMGVLNTGYHVVAPFNRLGIHTDDDIMYECNQIYKPGEISQRRHPGSLRAEDLSRGAHDRDTLPFILSCRRITSISSNALFEAMLWGRTAVAASDAIPFSFMCERDYKSGKLCDISFLNFYLINALIPNQVLLFSDEYWKKFDTASELEIFRYHLSCIFEALGIAPAEGETPTAEAIRQARNWSENWNLPLKCKTSLYYGAMESKLVVSRPGGEDEYFCINYAEGDTVKSHFIVHDLDGKISFAPHEEKTGFIRINRVLIDGNELYFGDGFLYFRDRQYQFTLPIDKPAKNAEVLIEWAEEENTIQSVRKVSEEVSALKRELADIRQSASWRLTEPLRRARYMLDSIFRRNES